MNDSQTPLGSNRDRHELVGHGLIGDGLATFLSHPAFAGLPAITETWKDEGEATGDLDRMRTLRRNGRAPAGARLTAEYSRRVRVAVLALAVVAFATALVSSAAGAGGYQRHAVRGQGVSLETPASWIAVDANLPRRRSSG